jgi:hypothetical protein
MGERKKASLSKDYRWLLGRVLRMNPVCCLEDSVAIEVVQALAVEVQDYVEPTEPDWALCYPFSAAFAAA